jgi:predicted transcriptional regulator
MNPEAVAWLNQFSGLELDDRQRLALVYLNHHNAITNSEYRRLTHVDAAVAGHELRGLVQAGLVEQRGAGRWTTYALKARKASAGATGEVAREDGTKLALSRHQVEILYKCQEDSSLLDLIIIAGRSDRTKFRHQVLNPLLERDLVEMTIPDKPRSSRQKYRLTEKGRRLLTQMGKDS